MKKVFLLLTAVCIIAISIISLSSCGGDCKVTFDSNGGSEVDSQNVNSGYKLEEPVTPVRDGYAFIGWYLDDVEWSFEGHRVSKSMTLVAKWAKCLIFKENDDGTYTVSDYKPIAEKITVPSTYKGEKVTKIGNGAFIPTADPECHLMSISIPDTVEEIGSSAFKGCERLTEITLPSSVTAIGNGAFENCISLERVSIPKSVEKIGYQIFKGCDDVELDEENGISYLGDWVVKAEGDIKSATIKDGTVGIAGGAFSSCAELKTVSLPNTLKYIGEMSFANCTSLEEIDIPEGVEELVDVFDSCSSLRRVSLPNGLKTIGESCFSYCVSLREITIPSSVNKLGAYAFQKTMISTVTLPQGITEIPSDLFNCCEQLTEIIIPEGVTRIERQAFNFCTVLDRVTLPSTLKSIGERAFASTTNLNEISLPQGLEIIEDYAFCYGGLTRIVIPKSVSEIGYAAFDNNKLLTEIYCEAESQPEGWSRGWYDYIFFEGTLSWGYKGNN
ncbi:MAG: leucine-rich repeat protein [Clostridia bacterium]|nr:leucine-rich repeat protein [Clostridia bacterium]